MKIVESAIDDAQSELKLSDAGLKIKKSLYKLGIKFPSFAQVSSMLDIYGTKDPSIDTMATNGSAIIYCPDFVLEQEIDSLVFVIIHEILHCLNEHHKRMGNRDPELWNIACDYAINFLLSEICEVDDNLKWPTKDGKKIGLYYEKFGGLSAEAIYDIIEKIKDELPQSSKFIDVKEAVDGRMGEVLDENVMPTPDKNNIVRIQKDDDSETEAGSESKESGVSKEGGESKGSGDSKGSEETSKLPLVGQKVILKDGRSAVIKKVYQNGDIEI